MGLAFFLWGNGGAEQSKVEYSNLYLDAENEVVNYPLSFEFAEDNFYTGKIRISVDIKNSGDSKVSENVNLFLEDSETEGKSGKLQENRTIELGPGETKTENFVVLIEEEDNYIVRIGEESESFRAVDPADNPSLYSEHYYSVARDYVPRDYDVPENKDIEGLVKFLNQIEMPPYRSEGFAQSHSTAMLEWLLEGGDFDAEIVVYEPDVESGEIFQHDWESGNSWVIVNVENREIAIRSVLLGSESWVGTGNYYKKKVYYEPPGIVETLDNYFRKNSIELSDFSMMNKNYYYRSWYNRYGSAEEFQENLNYVGKANVNWWGNALVNNTIKSTLPENEPFSTWVFG